MDRPLLKLDLGQPQGDAEVNLVLVGGGEGDLGLGHASCSVNGALHIDRTFHGGGVECVVVGNEQARAPSQGGAVGKNVAVVQRVVCRFVAINGCVVQGLAHKQGREGGFRGDAVHGHLLGKGHAVLVGEGHREEGPICIHTRVRQGDAHVADGRRKACGLFLTCVPLGGGAGSVKSCGDRQIASAVHAQSGRVDAQTSQVGTQSAKGAPHAHDTRGPKGVHPAVSQDICFILGMALKGGAPP